MDKVADVHKIELKLLFFFLWVVVQGWCVNQRGLINKEAQARHINFGKTNQKAGPNFPEKKILDFGNSHQFEV